MTGALRRDSSSGRVEIERQDRCYNFPTFGRTGENQRLYKYADISLCFYRRTKPGETYSSGYDECLIMDVLLYFHRHVFDRIDTYNITTSPISPAAAAAAAVIVFRNFLGPRRERHDVDHLVVFYT